MCITTFEQLICLKCNLFCMEFYHKLMFLFQKSKHFVPFLEKLFVDLVIPRMYFILNYIFQKLRQIHECFVKFYIHFFYDQHCMICLRNVLCWVKILQTKATLSIFVKLSKLSHSSLMICLLFPFSSRKWNW